MTQDNMIIDRFNPGFVNVGDVMVVARAGTLDTYKVHQIRKDACECEKPSGFGDNMSRSVLIEYSRSDFIHIKKSGSCVVMSLPELKSAALDKRVLELMEIK